MTDQKETAGWTPAAEQAVENAQADFPPKPMLLQALLYVAKGWPVFPLKPRDKKPLTSHGYKDATTDKNQIEKWWLEHPSANIGLATGATSGFFVLDIDGEKGEHSLRQLEERFGSLPSTGEVITGGGGRHLYFVHAHGAQIPNSAGKLGAGLDIRGDGGYIVAPPSVHPSGKVYHRSVDTHESIVSPPDWLVQVIQRGQQGLLPSNDGASVAGKPLESIAEGCRNDELTRLCGKLLQCGFHPRNCLTICHAVNQHCCKPPLEQSEVYQIVNSIAGLELAKRKGQ